MVEGFPMELRNEVIEVMNSISKLTYNNCLTNISDKKCCFLLNDEFVKIPYRVYILDTYSYRNLTTTKKLIYHCIFSRSCDGFVRQKHINMILENDFPDWCVPYIVKITSEYVIEILDDIYDKLNRTCTKQFVRFYGDNREEVQLMYQQMVSYWNVHYRNQYSILNKYVGRKLFFEHYHCNGKFIDKKQRLGGEVC